MFRAGAKLGWWPAHPSEFAEWLTRDPPDVVVAPVGKPGQGRNDPFLVQPNFRRWLERWYRPVGQGEFWNTTYRIWKRTPRSVTVGSISAGMPSIRYSFGMPMRIPFSDLPIAAS